jgi:outer membrane receptor protein involved in Fe transport
MQQLTRVGVLASVVAAALTPVRDAAPQAEAPASALEEITVTGSRIRAVSGMNMPVPVTVLSAEEIAFSAPGGLVEALDKMPQFLNTSRPGTDQGIGTDANQSIVNMRGIGTNRTLILLNGRRIVPTTKQGTIDISVLPDSMIERVEVVTGGASAAYGTDAVAGVTNFILDTDFEGYTGHLQTGQSLRGDTGNLEASFGYGTAIGERAHVIAALDHSESDALETWDDREWFQDWGVVTNPLFGQPGQPQLLTFPDVTSTLYSFGGMLLQNGSALNRLVFQPDGSTTPYVLGSPFALAGTQSQTGGSGGANIQRDRALFGVMPNVDRQNLFVHGSYDLNDDLQLTAQLIAGSNEVDGNGFPSVLFGPWQATIYRGNPYLPANVAQTMSAENLASFGFSRMGSVADTTVSRLVQDNDFHSLTFGFEQNVNEWRIEGYVQTGRNEGVLDIKNFPRTDHLFAALDAVVNPATGEIVCNRTLFDPSFRCVPINLLGAGRASPEAIAYVTEGVKTATTVNKQRVLEVSADGSILDGWGAGPVSLAAGIAYREDTLNQVTIDPTNPTNDPSYVAVPVNNAALGIRGVPLAFAGVNSGVQFSIVPNFSGKVTVKEAFSELLVPLVADKRWAQQLNMTAAARWAEYTGSGGIWSWKTGLDWQAVDAVRLRATVSRDVRAANMSERYDAAGAGATVADPVFGNQNVTFTQIIGGNPNVAPEEADTRTLGFVIQPPGLDGFSVSADWYSIDIAGSIGQLGPQRIVTDCFLGATQLCAQITRDPATNVITGLRNVYLNLNEEAVSGADLEAVYTFDFGADQSMNLRLIGSWLNDHSITNLGAPRQDRAGETGALSLPDLQVIANATYRRGPLTVFLQQRFIDEGLRRYNGNRPEIGGQTIDDNTVASVIYTDLRVSYEFGGERSGNWEVFANVNNLFDKDPPRAANHSTFGGSTHTNVSLYDVIGRRMVVGANFSF